jgi:hypothetical protein
MSVSAKNEKCCDIEATEYLSLFLASRMYLARVSTEIVSPPWTRRPRCRGSLFSTVSKKATAVFDTRQASASVEIYRIAGVNVSRIAVSGLSEPHVTGMGVDRDRLASLDPEAPVSRLAFLMRVRRRS